MQPTPEQEAILREEKLGILATHRREGAPQLTPVNFVFDGDRIFVSITKERAKYHNIRRNPAVSLCVLRPEGRPYVTVYGTARIEEQDIVERTKAISSRIYARDLPDNFEELLRQQKRVLVELTPERFVP